MTPLDLGAKRKPALDEKSFQDVLAAAYVLQQHNESLRAKDPRLDNVWELTQVAETQSLLRAGGLGLQAAAQMIADRLRVMTDAAGVSISLTRDGYLGRVAESGAAARVPGSSIASHSLVATERLRNGGVFQSADAQNDMRLDGTTCRHMGVRALLAVPIQQSGEIAGLIELRWNKADSFHECDVRTSQLMAALVTETLTQAGGAGAALSEPPQPSPETALVNSVSEPGEEAGDEILEAAGNEARPEPNPKEERIVESAAADSRPDAEPPTGTLAAQCRVCGRPFRANESFCGKCSMPRVAGAPSEGLQSKWASLWYMQQAHEVVEEREESTESLVEADYRDSQAAEEAAHSGEETEAVTRSVWRHPARTPEPVRRVEESSRALPFFQDPIAPRSWDDMIRAAWGRVLRTVRLRMRRRDAVAAMVAITLLVLVVWAWPTPTTHVTWLESVLVELGVAQVPARPPAPLTGNPHVRVWVDVHTALYYCPGSQLYGKTRGGQFTTQHDAQQDRFEPATGTVCE